MNIEDFRTYCLSKKGVEEGFPFGDEVLVFKVLGKMFVAVNITWEVFHANLKCDPEYAIELREHYPEDIKPGYHMSKKHWNTVCFEGNLDDKFLMELTTHSYDLVVKGLRKKDRDLLTNL